MLRYPSSIIRHSPRRGFTLIELAIVLMIISLIVGGILTGRSLIRTSELDAVASEVGRYTQAVVDFRRKYNALPGDFSGATALWSSPAAGCPAGQSVSTDPPTATCDGNGDGRVTTQSAYTTANEYEQFRAWQHLADAGMIDGAYSGVAAASGNPMQAAVGANVPASKLTGAGYSLISLFPNDFSGSNVISLGQPHYYTGVNYMHILQFGAATGPMSTLYPALTPAEAQSIDAKLDDGLPGSGKVIAPRSDSAYSPGCTTTASASTAAYNVTQTGVACSLTFLLGF